MGYLRWVPVELEQQPRLVSVTAVIVFRRQSFSNWRKWSGVEGLKDELVRRMTMEANIQVRLEAEKR